MSKMQIQIFFTVHQFSFNLLKITSICHLFSYQQCNCHPGVREAHYCMETYRRKQTQKNKFTMISVQYSTKPPEAFIIAHLGTKYLKDLTWQGDQRHLQKLLLRVFYPYQMSHFEKRSKCIFFYSCKYGIGPSLKTTSLHKLD